MRRIAVGRFERQFCFLPTIGIRKNPLGAEDLISRCVLEREYRRMRIKQ